MSDAALGGGDAGKARGGGEPDIGGRDGSESIFELGIGGGMPGGAGGGRGGDDGGAIGSGVDGDGKTCCWFDDGGLILGSGCEGCWSLISPTCWTCSRGGSL